MTANYDRFFVQGLEAVCDPRGQICGPRLARLSVEFCQLAGDLRLEGFGDC